MTMTPAMTPAEAEAEARAKGHTLLILVKVVRGGLGDDVYEAQRVEGRAALVELERRARVAENALLYTLKRTQTDPDFAYHVDPFTETYAQLTAGLAALRGVEISEIVAKFSQFARGSRCGRRR